MTTSRVSPAFQRINISTFSPAVRSRFSSVGRRVAVVAMVLAVLHGWGIGMNWAQPTVASSDDSQALRPVFSQDGTKLASAGADGRIAVMDLASGSVVANLGDAQGPVGALAFSPDGRFLASAKGGEVTLWELATGTESSVLHTDPAQTVDRITFSPTGNRLAAVLDDVEIAIWDLGQDTRNTMLPQTGQAVTGIAFSADGNLLASVGTGPQATVWDLAARQQRQTLSSPTAAPITGVAFSPVGNTLAAADEDANISLWDLDSGADRVLSGHADLVKRLLFSPNGARLASEGMDGQIIVWGLQPGQEPVSLSARVDTLDAGLAFSRDGALLASVAVNDDVLLWDVKSGALIQALEGHGALVRELAFSASWQTLGSVAADGRVIVWNLPAGVQRFAIQVPTTGGDVSVSAVEPTATIASGAASDNPSLSTVTAGGPEASASTRTAAPASGVGKKLSKRIRALAVSTDGSKVAAATDNGLVRLGVGADDHLSDESANTLAGATGLAFSAIRGSLYSVSRDTQLRRWSSQNGQLLQALHGHEHPITAVAVSHNDRYVATAGEETRILVWSETGKLVRVLNAHRDFVNAVAFNPKKLELASAGRDGLILLWSPEQQEPIRALLGHAGAVNALAYSNDGRTLASGSADSTVKLWSVSDGRQLANLAHSAPVRAVAVSRNDRYLASAADDTRISIWDLKAGGTLVKTLTGGSDLVASLAFLPAEGSLQGVRMEALLYGMSSTLGPCGPFSLCRWRPPGACSRTQPLRQLSRIGWHRRTLRPAAGQLTRARLTPF